MTTISTEKKILFIASGTLLIAILLFLFKTWAYSVTESKAILSDAMESIVNISAAAVALGVLRIAVRPADDDHPYGHGKLEDIVAAFEGGLIGFAGLVIIFQSFTSIFDGPVLNHLGFGLAIVAGAGIINASWGWFLLVMGKKLRSRALYAGGVHLLSDFWTSVGVIFGLIIVLLTGWFFLDPLVALLVAFWLLWSSYRLLSQSIHNLMDGRDTRILKELVVDLERSRFDEVLHIHHLRVLRSGRLHHVDCHVVLPEVWSVEKASQAISVWTQSLEKESKTPIEFAFHIDSCGRKHCRICPLEECPVRQQAFEGLQPLSFEETLDPRPHFERINS